MRRRRGRRTGAIDVKKDDKDYLRRREREESRLADAASGTSAGAIHRELSERYAQALARANLPVSAEPHTAGDS